MNAARRVPLIGPASGVGLGMLRVGVGGAFMEHLKRLEGWVKGGVKGLYFSKCCWRFFLGFSKFN